MCHLSQYLLAFFLFQKLLQVIVQLINLVRVSSGGVFIRIAFLTYFSGIRFYEFLFAWLATSCGRLHASPSSSVILIDILFGLKLSLTGLKIQILFLGWVGLMGKVAWWTRFTQIFVVVELLDSFLCHY